MSVVFNFYGHADADADADDIPLKVDQPLTNMFCCTDIASVETFLYD